MRYDLGRAYFRTPNGAPVIVWLREETNDWNTAFASLNEDEYGLRGRSLEGLCLDVGGYLGTVSIGLLVDNPNARVICVEPIPENVDLIERNASANGVSDRLTVIPGLVGRKGDEVTIAYRFEGGENELHHAFVGNASHIHSKSFPHQSVTHRASTIDDLVGDAEVAWTKVDCEGGEWGLFSEPGLEQLRYITGEWHNTPLPDGTTGSQALLRALLEPTHVLSITGPEGGPGGFAAVRR